MGTRFLFCRAYSFELDVCLYDPYRFLDCDYGVPGCGCVVVGEGRFAGLKNPHPNLAIVVKSRSFASLRMTSKKMGGQERPLSNFSGEKCPTHIVLKRSGGPRPSCVLSRVNWNVSYEVCAPPVWVEPTAGRVGAERWRAARAVAAVATGGTCWLRSAPFAAAIARAELGEPVDAAVALLATPAKDVARSAPPVAGCQDAG